MLTPASRGAEVAPRVDRPASGPPRGVRSALGRRCGFAGHAIHLIETGRSRPSPETLAHIARRTGKPVSYFLGATAGGPEPSPGDVARHSEELMRQVAWKLARLLRYDGLNGIERIALEGVLLDVRHGMRLIQTLHEGAWGRDQSAPAAAPVDSAFTAVMTDAPTVMESHEEPRDGGAHDLR